MSSTLLQEFHQFIRTGDKKAVRGLINDGLDVNSTSIHGTTAILVAVMNSKDKILELLLRAGADSEVQNAAGNTVLHLAYALGNKDAVRILESIGGKALRTIKNSRGKVPSEMSNEGNDSGEEGSESEDSEEEHEATLNILATCFKSKVKPIQSIRVASKLGDIGAVANAVANGANVNITSSRGRTALMEATKRGHLNIIKFLVESGASTNVQDIDGNTCFHIACKSQRHNIVRYLDMNLPSGSKEVRNNDGDLPWDLLYFGMDPSNQIFAAIQHADAVMIQQLVSGNENLVNTLSPVNIDGEEIEISPLMFAAKEGSFESLKLLMDLNADIHKLDSAKNTALHYAYKGLIKDADSSDIVKYLEDWGAIMDKSVENSKGNTPSAAAYASSKSRQQQLHIACKLADIDKLETLLNDSNKNDQSSGDTVDVNSTTKSGSTLLMHAAWNGHLDVTKLLLQYGARPNIQNIRGNTALHFAYERGHKALINPLYA